jgi:hypothetical protein
MESACYFPVRKVIAWRQVRVMVGSTQPDDAASALTEIGRRQAQVIDAVLVPVWYWWIVAAGMVAIGAAADYKQPAGIVVAALVIAGLTTAMILGAYHRVRVRDADLLRGPGALLVVGTVWLIVGLTIGLAFGLRALGSPAPGTIATAGGGVALIVCGPRLMRRLRRIMMSRRAGVGA